MVPHPFHPFLPAACCSLSPSTLYSPLPFVQSAAAARILDKPDIIEAAKSGNIGLVRDHVIVDPLSIHKQSHSL
jgi:hypothetical protein